MAALGRGELYTEDELKTLLAREISKRPWPTVGTVVSISHDWDGPSTYNSEEFLALKSQDRVRVTEVSPLGAWLRGTVVGSNRNGWFGGPGCEAAMSVNLDIPLGSEMDEELPFAKADLAFDEDDGDLGDLEKDLEDYVARNHVDSSAATALKALSPEMQAEIIKNDMTNCRSPSAVLLSRIEKLKAQWPHTGAPGRPVAPTVAPRRAAPAASLALAPVTASRVLPSTAPAGAVPQLRGSAARSRSPRGPHPRKETKENWEKGPDVEDFIERYQLDERAVGQLRSLAPEELQMLVNADLTNARNPSAVVLSRIQRIRDDSHRDAHRHAVEEYLSRNSVDEVAGGAFKMLPMEVQQQIMQSDLSNSRNPSAVLLSRIRAAEASLGVPAGQPPPPGGGGWGHGGQGGHGGGHGGHGGGSPPAPQGGWGHGGGGGWGPNQMVEDFIQQYGLDEKVAVDLRMLPEQEVQEVMSCNIRNARNPSAMVRSRIQAVQSKSKFLYMVEDYLGRYEVDEVAASALRNATQEVQTRVMEEEMVNCRNPSAVLISRIRAIEKGQR